MGGGPASSGSGDIVGVIFESAPPYYLVVPHGYTSGSPISSTQTFTGASFSSLGLTQGTYTYVWSTDSLNVVVGSGGSPTPAPGPTPAPTPAPSGSCSGVGTWYFYSDEGSINAGPPVGNGNAIFTINGGGPITETFNPNKTDGTTNIYFDLKDSTGTDYSTQFNAYITGGYTGTISICQNGKTATYVGQGVPGSFLVNSGGGTGFFIMNLSMLNQTASAASKFNYTDPISITFS
jgi:hypothetical protein